MQFLTEKSSESILSFETCKKCEAGGDSNEHKHDHRALEEVESVYLNLEKVGRVMDKAAFENFMG